MSGTQDSRQGSSQSPGSEAAGWRREHADNGAPEHDCDPVEFKDSAGFVAEAFCGVCGRVMLLPNDDCRDAAQ